MEEECNRRAHRASSNDTDLVPGLFLMNDRSKQQDHEGPTTRETQTLTCWSEHILTQNMQVLLQPPQWSGCAADWPTPTLGHFIIRKNARD